MRLMVCPIYSRMSGSDTACIYIKPLRYTNRNRKPKISTALTKAKSREPASSQALIQNKIDRRRVRPRESGCQAAIDTERDRDKERDRETHTGREKEREGKTDQKDSDREGNKRTHKQS